MDSGNRSDQRDASYVAFGEERSYASVHSSGRGRKPRAQSARSTPSSQRGYAFRQADVSHGSDDDRMRRIQREARARRAKRDAAVAKAKAEEEAREAAILAARRQDHAAKVNQFRSATRPHARDVVDRPAPASGVAVVSGFRSPPPHADASQAGGRTVARKKRVRRRRRDLGANHAETHRHRTAAPVVSTVDPEAFPMTARAEARWDALANSAVRADDRAAVLPATSDPDTSAWSTADVDHGFVKALLVGDREPERDDDRDTATPSSTAGRGRAEWIRGYEAELEAKAKQGAANHNQQRSAPRQSRAASARPYRPPNPTTSRNRAPQAATRAAHGAVWEPDTSANASVNITRAESPTLPPAAVPSSSSAQRKVAAGGDASTNLFLYAEGLARRSGYQVSAILTAMKDLNIKTVAESMDLEAALLRSIGNLDATLALLKSNRPDLFDGDPNPPPVEEIAARHPTGDTPRSRGNDSGDRSRRRVRRPIARRSASAASLSKPSNTARSTPSQDRHRVVRFEHVSPPRPQRPRRGAAAAVTTPHSTARQQPRRLLRSPTTTTRGEAVAIPKKAPAAVAVLREKVKAGYRAVAEATKPHTPTRLGQGGVVKATALAQQWFGMSGPLGDDEDFMGRVGGDDRGGLATLPARLASSSSISSEDGMGPVTLSPSASPPRSPLSRVAAPTNRLPPESPAYEVDSLDSSM